MERRTRHLLYPALLSTLFSTPAVQADWSALNLTKGVTPISNQVYDLHMTIMWICVVIGIIVFGAMAYSIIYHRKSKGVKPATFHESTKLEILWTLIPFAILIAIAVPASAADQALVIVPIPGLLSPLAERHHHDGRDADSHDHQRPVDLRQRIE